MSPDISYTDEGNADLFETVEQVLGILGWQFDRDGHGRHSVRGADPLG